MAKPYWEKPLNKNLVPTPMAKRRKEKDEESDDKPFKAPKFDEESFIKKEKRNIRATVIAFLFGCLMALVCFAFWALMGNQVGFRWTLVLLLAIANVTFLKFVFERLKIDISDFTKKNWFTNIMIYFFTWLLVMIVIVNPPFYDDETPLVDLVVLPDVQEFGGTVEFIAKITDNAGVEKSGISLSINDEAIDNSNFDFEENIFTYIFNSPSNSSIDLTYDYEIKVDDINGNQKQETGSFSYSDDAIRLASNDDAYTSPGPMVYSATPISFEVKADVDNVYYTVNNGSKIYFNSSEKIGEYYTTYPGYEGWIPNQNVTVRVYAESINYFKIVLPTNYTTGSNLSGLVKKYNNTIVDSQVYYFQTGTENIGLKTPPTAEPVPVEYVQVPGFETIILLAALAAIVLIFKYKKKDEHK